MISLVNLTRQNKYLKRKLMKSISRVIDEQSFILGPEVAAFEQEFAAYCTARYAVGVASGYDAIFLSLRALGVGHGDEVITQANTFISTVLPILAVGATPKLVDVDPTTLSMDVSLVASRITPRTRAIIPVHLFGLPVDMEPLLRLAKKHNLRLIEDACQAHGALYNGKHVGSFGDTGCFSFYPSKNFGAFGDGGAVITNDQGTADSVRVLRNLGQKGKNIHAVIGVNSRLDTIQAAILRVKLPYLSGWVRRRRQIAVWYREGLAGLPLTLVNEPAYATASYHLFVVRTHSRDKLMRFLKSHDILCGIHYPIPIHLQPCLKSLGYRKGDFPVSEQSATELLSLPMDAELTRPEVQKVVYFIRTFFKRI